MKLVRVAFPLAALLALPAPEKDARERQRQLEGAVSAQFLNQTFQLKLTVGNSIRYQNSQYGCLVQYIDTEIRPDGNVLYLARRSGAHTCSGQVLLTGGPAFHAPFEQLTGTVPRGAEVTVTKIEWMNDRLELQLSGPNKAYAKLKLFFGGPLARDASPDSVIPYLARYLRIEAFEVAARIEATYRSHLRSLAATLGVAGETPSEDDFRRFIGEVKVRAENAALPTTGSASAQIGFLRQLYLQATNLASNRREAAAALATAGPSGSPDDSLFWQQTADRYQARISELEKLAREDRKEEMRHALEKLRAEYKTQPSPPATPRTLDEISQAETQVQRRLSILQQQRTLMVDLTGLGESPDTDLSLEIEREEQRLSEMRLAWQNARSQLELKKLNDDYVPLRLRLNETERAYRGNPYAYRQQYLSLLETLRANREEAVRRGDPQAAKQLEAIRQKLAAVR